MISTAGYFIQAAAHRFPPPLACVEIMAVCDGGIIHPLNGVGVEIHPFHSSQLFQERQNMWASAKCALR